MLDDAIDLRDFDPGEEFSAGPFGVRSWLLPHWVPNAGRPVRAAKRGWTTGPSALR
jgi:hypothetical protein